MANKQIFLNALFEYLNNTFNGKYNLTREYFENELTPKELIHLIIDNTDFFDKYFYFNKFGGLISYNEYIKKYNLESFDDKKDCLKINDNNIYIQYHETTIKHLLMSDYKSDVLLVNYELPKIKQFCENVFKCLNTSYQTDINMLYEKYMCIAFFKHINIHNFEDFKNYLKNNDYFLLVDKNKKYHGIYRKINAFQIIKVIDIPSFEEWFNFENMSYHTMYMLYDFITIKTKQYQ